MFFLENNLDNNKKYRGKKLPIFSKLYTFFCKRKQFLNIKIIIFFFNIVFLSVKDFEFSSNKSLNGSNFFYNYKILFIFLKFVYFLLDFINKYFKMNSEKFFSEKKDLIEFLIYYKFYLFIIFLNKKNKFFNILIKFSFNLFSNYLLYSVFYFLRFFLLNLQNIQLKNKKVKNKFVYFIPVLTNSETSSLFYKKNIFKLNTNSLNKEIDISKEDIPLHLFCSNRVNYKFLDDSQFSEILGNIRYFYRCIGKKQNSFGILNKIVKKAIPLSKIVYQRRGRNFIPLMTFIYSQDIRTSLGIKVIFSESNNVIGLAENSFKNKLLINLLDLLIFNKKIKFLYQSNIDTLTRKEAYNKGYYLKTLKAKIRKLK